LQLITKLDRALAKGEEVLLALLLVGMVLLAALQVLLRNIWDTGIDWADITLQNVTVLVGLLGAAVATSEGRHLNIDILSRVLRGRARTVLKLLIGLFAISICAMLTRGGWSTYRVNYEPWLENIPEGWSVAKNLKVQFLEGSIPQWLSLLFLPLGFAVIGFHFLLRLIRDVGTLITGKAWEEVLQTGAEGDVLLDQMTARADDDDTDGGNADGGKGGAP
jgi:TRAP-type C4-dicarboxylate transport system permease small subunit